MSLEVKRSNEAALGLYWKMGFKIEDELGGEWLKMEVKL